MTAPQNERARWTIQEAERLLRTAVDARVNAAKEEIARFADRVDAALPQTLD